MLELSHFGNKAEVLPAPAISGIDFDALTPSDLSELIRVARIRGMSIDDAPEVRETMARFVNEFMATSGRYSQRTMTQLACAWGSFARWCDENSLTYVPAKPETVVRYLSHRAMTVHRNSVASDRWAIGRMHRAAGCPDPAGDPRVSDTLSAIVRQKVAAEERIEQASPMRECYLDQLVDLWRGSQQANQRRDLALLTLAYETLLRAAEVSRVKMRHLAIQPDGSGVLTVPITKTNVSGEPDKIALSRQAVSLAMEYLQLAGRTYDSKSDAALFCAGSKHGTAQKRGAPLTVKTIERIFARAHEALGLSAMGIAMWTGHSARVGAAQDMAASGCTILQIMQAGRWGSEAMVLRYCRDILASEGAMAIRRAGRV